MTITTGKKKEKIDRLAELAAREDERGVSLWKEAFRRLRRNPAAIVGAVILSLFLLVAILGPFFVPHAPDAQLWKGEIRLGDFPGFRAENWFGVDHIGRDEFSRMIVGARQTLLVGVVSTLIGLAVGSLIGGVAGAAAGLGGRWGRAVDNVLMRFVDMLLAMPSLLLAISIAALLGAGLTTVMIAVGVVSVPVFARLLRGSMISQANSDYVLAAVSLGVKKPKIALTHVVPNSLAPVIVQATLTLATAIIEAAALSFLGLGNNDASIPEWGVMLADAQQYLDSAPRLAILPALAIIVTALGFTLLGEAMREALDPKLRK
ncbi:ABC transporter permease [Micromonospora peucetia]|uniref:ABC transporter permease n=1 Tax=Micromonospora peucetia TaxID=47871 RepID=A0A1C6V1C0_9ACTN|nr:ABC transporter permease [Micromonospora peucetia]MCX4388992.1 ABC transporter permease [Micromonospora peucetia]WSA35200.1 ABC transporter permease [Micromonospora peucetia]SCL60073.1 peptide/nickel transport system permease protein [Micromonospora peucetia]